MAGNARLALAAGSCDVTDICAVSVACDGQKPARDGHPVRMSEDPPSTDENRHIYLPPRHTRRLSSTRHMGAALESFA